VLNKFSLFVCFVCHGLSRLSWQFICTESFMVCASMVERSVFEWSLDSLKKCM